MSDEPQTGPLEPRPEQEPRREQQPAPRHDVRDIAAPATRLVPALVATLTTALLTALAFAPWLRPEAVLVLFVPVLWVTRGLGPRRRLWLGWICGLGLELAKTYWVGPAGAAVAHLPGWLGYVLTAVHAAFYGLELGLFAVVAGSRTLQRSPLWPLAAAAIWVAIEYFSPRIFPWFAGNALHSWLFAVQSASLLGVSWLSLLVVWWNATLLTIALALFGRRAPWLMLAPAAAPDRTESGRRLPALGVPLAIVLGVVIIANSVFGLVRLNAETDAERAALRLVGPEASLKPVAPAIRFAVVQPNIIEDWWKAVSRKRRTAIFEQLVAFARAAVQRGASIVIFPEGVFPFHYQSDGAPCVDMEEDYCTYSKRFSARLRATVRALGTVTLVLGSLRRDKTGHYNSAIVLSGPGGREQLYDKRVLLEFGETIPGRRTLEGIFGPLPLGRDLVEGTRSPRLRIGGREASLSICYEAILPRVMRTSSTELTRLLINLTSDEWFGDTPEPRFHLLLQQMRSVELGVPLLRSANTGISAVVDRFGRLVASSRLNSASTILVDIDLDRAARRPLYASLGELIAWLSLVASIAIGVGLYLDRRRTSSSSPA
ncbi:MAG: apolipoprotein N-acyltransferase [Myxococcales bacterium]|nr:apolipoprotein N-acyltransferase [Myxococcales bacterium]